MEGKKNLERDNEREKGWIRTTAGRRGKRVNWPGVWTERSKNLKPCDTLLSGDSNTRLLICLNFFFGLVPKKRFTLLNFFPPSVIVSGSLGLCNDTDWSVQQCFLWVGILKQTIPWGCKWTLWRTQCLWGDDVFWSWDATFSSSGWCANQCLNSCGPQNLEKNLNVCLSLRILHFF